MTQPSPNAVPQADPADAERRIAVPRCPNLRDLGGYPAAGGRTTRWRTLLRSGSLRPAGADAVGALAEYGLRTVIDLRTAAEADRAPSPPGIAARTMLVSLLGPEVRGLPPGLEPVYRYVIEERGDQVGSAISALARPGALPALVHCAAGKDRTGIVIGLVLAVLGVPDEIIAADYALSSGYLGAQAAAIVGDVQDRAGLDRQATAGLLASPPALILDVLARARDAAGTVEGYLLAHGVSGADLGTLRASLAD
ncbi:MAG TPA: tyrosine-protein phosphatase [Streptosporangiaceae bacterium]